MQKHIVIIGGGFGGLLAAKHLKGSAAKVTLIDKSNHHLFQPLLYQVAAGALSPADIATPLRIIFKRQKNLRILMDEVTAIDRHRRKILLLTSEPLTYDYLIVATGASPSYFGHDDWKAHAPGLKEIRNALEIRQKTFLSFEKWVLETDPQKRKELLTLVLVGGGPTGVELAGAFAEISSKAMENDFPQLKPKDITILLIEASDRLLGSFDPKLSEAARKGLVEMGVQVLLNTPVENITEEGVMAGGKLYPSQNIIWTAGNAASALLKSLATSLDKSGHVLVGPDLSLPEDPNVFVIGDAAHINGPNGYPLPAVAQVAMQQGMYASKIILKELGLAQPAPRLAKPFVYNDLGSMATIGRASAIAEIGNLKLHGFLAWLMWAFVHVSQLVNFRSRIIVFIQWIAYYITFIPNASLVYPGQQESKLPDTPAGTIKAFPEV